MANWAEKFDEENDKRREAGLNRRLEELEESLNETEDLQEKKVLLKRILDIMNELKVESFDYDKNKFMEYYVKFKQIKVKIETRENKKRENGLRNALYKYQKRLEQTEKTDYKEQYILLNRINNIYSEIELEGFFYYPEEYEKTLKEQEKIKKLLEQQEEREKQEELIEKHQKKDTSWEEFKEEEEDFDR